MSSSLSSPLRRWLLAAFAAVLAIGVAVGVGPAALTSPALAAPHHHDPTITILTSGDRTRSMPGTASATGGMVTGVEGVTYRVTGPGGFSDDCTSDRSGSCSVTGPAAGTYTITQVSAPAGNTPAQDDYFINGTLGTGTSGGVISASPYETLTVDVPATGLTVPVGSTKSTSDVTTRSGRWAVSRYNPPPPTTCTRSVALLFDLSASITAGDLADYKTSAIGFVRALLGTSTDVTLYTFGTTAPASGAPNTTFGPRNTFDMAGVNALVARINGLTLPTTAQYTNWDAGIWQIANSGVHYNEAVVLTDGDPTAFGSTGDPDASGTAITRFRDVENGIFSANALKAKGTRVIAVGIAHNSAPGSIDNLKAISGPDEGSDYFIIPFDHLDGLLTDIAVANCAKLSIVKTASVRENPADPTVYTAVGQHVDYTYTVTNTSPHDGFPLHNISVTDSLLGTITDCVPDTLAPGETATCHATHVVTQADLDRGIIQNTAFATGKTPNETPVTSGPDSEDVNALQDPHITVTKTATPKVYTAGTVITYHYTVQNTGDVTLHNVTVHDDVVGTIACTPTTLAPGQFATCPAGTHTATEADVAAGSIHNTVTATGTTQTGRTVTDEDEQTVTAETTPAIRVTKSVTPATFTEGTTLTYSFTVTNTGDVPLHNVTVVDSLLGTIACTPTTLAVGASGTCPTATHVATAADVAAGSIHNNVTATGTDPQGETVMDEAERTVFPEIAPAIRVTKSVTPATFTEGTTLTYSFTVTNTGNVTLHDVTVVDSLLGTIDCTPTTLAPGASGTCPTATHVATAADVAAGSIHNNVTATGTAPDGQKVDDEAEQTVEARTSPAISVTKTASPKTYTEGTVITYDYTVTNTGDVTLHGVTVVDSVFGTITCTPTTLAPEASATCTPVTHTADAADVAAGKIHNTVTATGTAPDGTTVTDDAEETVTSDTSPGIEVTKKASPTTYTEGTVITYTYTVTNTGDVTLHGVTVVDSVFGTVTCTPTTLAPAASATCTPVTHTATEADVAAGSIHNTVTATGTAPDGTTVTDDSEQTVFPKTAPAIKVTKTASPTTYTEGTVITYAYTVTNTGDVTLHGVTVVDSVFGPITCTPTTLAPGASATCTPVTHTADVADVAAGEIHNNVTATGTDPQGRVVTDEDEQTVFAEFTPGIEVTKTASPATYTEGTVITYTYTVTNTGDVTLSNVTVVDSRFGAITCTPTTLAPGASATCTPVSHTADAADVAAGEIHNNVTASGTDPQGGTVTDEDEQTVFPEIAPAITVTKTASTHEYTGPGEVITYTYTVTNTGDVTLHDVTVVDDKFGTIHCTPTTLAPGASATCTAVHHTTTQADVDAGSIANSVLATGTAPGGEKVTDEDFEDVTAGLVPSIEITKTAMPPVYSMHGQLITYIYTVSNTGNVTLRDVTLDDTLFGTIPCPRTTLAPGETMTCTHIHAVSDADLDEGSIFNSAAATGRQPNGKPVRSEPEHALVLEEKVVPPPVVPVTG